MVIAVLKKKKNQKQSVGNSESEGILSDNCAIHVGYCVTVVGAGDRAEAGDQGPEK